MKLSTLHLTPACGLILCADHAAGLYGDAFGHHGRTPLYTRYVERLDEPVAESLPDVSLRGFLSGWCVWKDVHNITDEAFTGALQLARNTLRQVEAHALNIWRHSHVLTNDYRMCSVLFICFRGNVDIPVSIHFIRQILRMRSAADVQWHFCACKTGHAWPPLPKQQWRLPEDEGFRPGTHPCPHCGHPRFEKQLHGGRTQLQPLKVRPVGINLGQFVFSVSTGADDATGVFSCAL